MAGLEARPNKTGFVAVRLHYSADPLKWTPKLVAQEKLSLPGWRWRKEMEIDFLAQAGQPVFMPEFLDRQRRHLREPAYRMDLDPSGKLVKREGGRLSVFLGPGSQPEDLPDNLTGVIRHFGIGMDVGEGVGESDSTIEVFTADTRHQAAELASNRITPTDLGRFAAAVGRYYNEALICCVRKMHGLTAIRAMLDEAHYPLLWHHRMAERLYERRANYIGWAKGETTGSPDELLFGRLVDALQYEQIVIHSVGCLEQLGQYIYDENGRITLQVLADSPIEVRRRHGDMVVGVALALRACMDLPKFKAVVERPKTVIEQEFERRAARRKSIWRQ